MVFCNGVYFIPSKIPKNGVLLLNTKLVLLLIRLYINTNRIFHPKTLKKWCFAMGYPACITIKSTLQQHKPYISL